MSSSTTTDRVYAYIREFVEDHGYSPLFAEVARGCQLSTSTVEDAASELRAVGKIDWTPRVFRSLRLVNLEGEGMQAHGDPI